MPKPTIKKRTSIAQYPEMFWLVEMEGKQPVRFPYFWVAVSFAVYAFRHPHVMAERL